MKKQSAPRPSKVGQWESLLLELKTVARDLGISVRYDARLTNAGGYCRVRGEPLILIPSHLPVSEQVHLLSRALRAAGDEKLDALPMRPSVRALLTGA